MTKRQTHRVRLGALAGAGVLVLVAGITFATDGGTVDVQVADNTHSVINALTDDGALVSYIGDGDTSFGSSGTGVFESFVRLQADGTEAGYNTNGTLQFDTKSGKWTHAIKVSDIPVVAVDGKPYWELWADINESNSARANASHISLDKLEVYFANSATVTGYPTFGGNAQLKYDFAGEILINDVNQGSGRGDLRYMVPVSTIDIPANCSYKNPACDTWFVLYSQWGGAKGAFPYASDGGFEEWKVKQYPYVFVSKTATPSFTRTHTWTIEKSVDKDSHSLFDGETGDSNYSVKVTKTTTDSNYAVSGSITITNPGTESAVISSVTDVITDSINVTPACGVTFPYTLPKGGTLNCTYSSGLTDASSRTNTATVMLDYGGLFKGTAPIDFTGVTPTVVGYDSIDVTDTYGGALGSTDATTTFTYKRTFDCSEISFVGGSGSKTYPNTATITQTGQSDSESVDVTCYRLSVSKDATPSFTRTHTWEIDKSVDKDSYTLFDGQSGESTYSVKVTKTTTDSNYAVSGTITITNPAPMDATVSSLLDDISGLAGDPTPSCPSATVQAGGTLVCTYTSALPNADSRTNTATATAYGVTYTSNVAPIDFSGVTPSVVGYGSIDVTDTNAVSAGNPTGALGSTDATRTFTYKRTFDCSEISFVGGSGSKTYPNTATITQTGQSDSESVDVTCYRLSVDKTATTSYDRDFDWTITKSVDKGELTLQNGASTTVNYTIVATKSAAQDSNFAVSGSIKISNPATMDATLTSVEDSISGIGDISVSCPSKTVPAGGTLTCTYSSSLPDKTSRTNTATVVAYTKSYTDDAAVTFGDPTNVTDNCATVTDSLKGSLGTICETTTFNYSRTVGPYFDCDDYTVNNTAKVTEADSGDYDTDSASVLIHVVGCGNLFHTGTTCAQYYLGAPPVGLAGTQIDTVEYSVKSGLINQVNPGVFFYYTDFTASSGTASVKINQTPPGSYGNPMAVQNNNQVRVFDASCNTYSNFTFSVANGDVMLTINGLTSGSDYIVSVKYDPGNLVGLAPPASPSVTYAWQTEFGGGTFGIDTLDLKLK